jgi:Raf kinase inhibitor-like YbhB/YbcL family protein
MEWKMKTMARLILFMVLIHSNHLGGVMEITSSAFEYGRPIPKKYTCQGQNISPPLQIKDYPENTESFAIILEDPDAPSGTFDHWVAWNITPTSLIDEGFVAPGEGLNGFGKRGYSGPCPPSGREHRYFFKVFALDAFVQLPPGSNKGKLYPLIKPHLLDEAELMGTYQRE